MKTRLFIQTYIPQNVQRKEELEVTLAHNQTILEVITVDRPDRITFKEWFGIINEYAEYGDISILANSDIKFDETIILANELRPDECFSLTRWDNGLMHNTGADTWIFRGKVKNVEDCEFGLGIADCDYAIQERLHRAGYRLFNPSGDIKTHHCHQSAFRTYHGVPGVPKPHLNHIAQTALKYIRQEPMIHTSYSGSHVEFYENYLKPSLPKGAKITVKELPQHCPSGMYLSNGWLQQMTEKLDFMIEMVENNELFVYLDVDVKIRSPYAIHAMIEELGDCDIAFQKDRNTACAGVFIGRRNERTIELFNNARTIIESHGCDQPAINACLLGSGVKWKYLSEKFWNFSHFAPFEWTGKIKFQIPSIALLVHANWCRGSELKKKLLDMA